MIYTCPKCGKRLELSAEALIAADYKTVCPQCLTRLEIVGDYAYVPLDDGSLELRRADPAPEEATALQPDEAGVPLPSQLGGDGRDPLFDQAVRYLGECSAITPMMLRDYFGITIERAHDLIAQLEQAGCIGPYRGGAPRQILIDHREGLPSPYARRYDPNAPTDPTPEQQPQGKMVRINCLGCFFWSLLIGMLIALLVK